MNKGSILGIDLGGTQIRGGRVAGGIIYGMTAQKINAKASSEEMLQQLFSFTEPLLDPSVKAIGIGVPGLVHENIVYDVVNIPSWKKIPLSQLMEEKFRLPVRVNNDANCFALGEYHYGKGQGFDSMIGLTIGTGLGSGIIIGQKLFSGHNGGAGEFGMMEYLDHCYEYYASGQFFENIHHTRGEKVFKAAGAGDADAIGMYEEMGTHLGKAIKAILYAYDVPLIVLGGSVSAAFPYFSRTMWEAIKTFGFVNALKNLKIEVSDLQNSGVLGAASLFRVKNV